MAGSALDTVPADDTSARLVDQLLADQWITSPAVRAAFHRVPRHLFAADGISLDVAYANDVIITSRGPDGRATSSISDPCFKPPCCTPLTFSSAPGFWRSAPVATTPR